MPINMFGNGLFRFLLSFCLLSWLGGCSASNLSAPADLSLNAMEVYLSRSSLSSTNFEQFKLIGQDLFRECGEIRRGRYVAKEQDLITLNDQAYQDLRQKAWEFTNVPELSNYTWAQAGRNRNLFDPGQLKLNLELSSGSTAINTSIDSISEHRNPPEKALLTLLESVRSIGTKSHCGYQGFFGVGVVR